MKDSRTDMIRNRHPLIDAGVSRKACLEWMASRGYPKPPRSACVFCPYHHDTEWRRLKNEEPTEFQRAVEFEREYQRLKIQTVSAKGFIPFLHASRVNLDLVDFSTEAERGQGELFGDQWNNECEGMCGV